MSKNPKEDEEKPEELSSESSDADEKTETKEPEEKQIEEPEEAVKSVETENVSVKQSLIGRIDHFYRARKRIAIPFTVVVLLIVLGVIPFTRYAVLGLFIRKDVTITVTDSQTHTPILKAQVSVGSESGMTDKYGKTSLKVPVGNQSLTISKQYYKTYDRSQFVNLSSGRNDVSASLVATGRIVPVTVINRFTGKPIEGAEVKAKNTEAATTSNGIAEIVLPSTSGTESAAVTAKGYNDTSETLQITGQVVPANTFSITPVGKLYFLSNLSGKIDVVKTNLDGTDRQTVLAGTGFEQPDNTVLLASRDWKYLALYTQRTQSGGPEIDLIDTSNDTMSNIDEGSNANFTIVGWDGDDFVYQVDRNNVQNWQNGRQVIKSFDATTKKITALAQTSGSGNSNNYIYQSLGSVYELGGKVVYDMSWTESPWDSPMQINGKQATFNTANPDGTGNTVVKSFPAPAGSGFITGLTVYNTQYDGPNNLAIAFSVDTNYTTDSTSYYEYENGTVGSADDINGQNFYSSYPTYLQSPSGSSLFWSVYADGKNNLNVGDSNGKNPKVIATENDYSPYGWYSDNYLLMSKNGSELYIQPADGSSQPFKITNYYKPQVQYNGYGGGYGGL